MKLYSYPRRSCLRYINQYPDLCVLQSQPQAYWINDWSAGIREEIIFILEDSLDRGEMPIFVWYMIPDRDLGSYSSGGVTDFEVYYKNIKEFFSLCHSNSLLIFEPDALALDFSKERQKIFEKVFVEIPTDRIKVFRCRTSTLAFTRDNSGSIT